MITAIQLKALEEPEKAHVSHIVWWYLVTVLYIYLYTVRLGECRNEYDIGQNPNTD